MTVESPITDNTDAVMFGQEFERWFGKLLTSEGLCLDTETEDTLVYVARDTDFAALSLTVRKKNLPNPPPKRLIVTTSYQPEFE